MESRLLKEYLSLERETLKTSTGKNLDVYSVTSDNPEETKRVKEKIKELGFKPFKPNKYSWEGFKWIIYANQLTNDIVDGLKKINQELQQGGGQTGNISDFMEKLENLKKAVDSTFINATKEEKTELMDRINGYVDELANAIDDEDLAKRINEFLDFANKFHNYSFYNQMLIYRQKRDATKVMGAKEWERRFNRTLKDGATPIYIFCKNFFTINEKTGKSIPYLSYLQRDDTNLVKGVESGKIKDYDEKEYKAAKFRLSKKFSPSGPSGFSDCTVYDVSDTVGDPVPEEPRWKGVYDDNVTAYALFQVGKKSLENDGIKVTQQSAFGGEGGWSSGGRINVSKGATGSGAVSTLFHEWAHELMHYPQSKFFVDVRKYIDDPDFIELNSGKSLDLAQIKQIKETQVETVANAVNRYFGIPSEHNTVYLAFWQKNGKMKAKAIMKKFLPEIRNTANHIIKEVSKYQNEINSIVAQKSKQPTEQ